MAPDDEQVEPADEIVKRFCTGAMSLGSISREARSRAGDVLERLKQFGKPVILAATGGTPMHGLMTEHQLRPLFGFFKALTLPTAVYALEQAHFATQLGAAYAAPYLGRLNDSGVDGLALIGRMQVLDDLRVHGRHAGSQDGEPS